jgi:hypothetical protein
MLQNLSGLACVAARAIAFATFYVVERTCLLRTRAEYTACQGIK